MEGQEEQDLYEQSFIDVPAILDKHKAAAEVTQGKSSIDTFIFLKQFCWICDDNSQNFNEVFLFAIPKTSF